MSLCINPNCLAPQNRDTLLFCQYCGSELLLAGRYRATQQLGGGGFGKTYEVSDRHNVRKVLKVLLHNQPKAIELFQREAQVLAQLDHPGIPQVDPDAYFTFLPADNSEPLHCLVMEKIEGLDLHRYLERRGRPVDEKCVQEWLQQLLKILELMHSRNVFHRDIKPANIMLKVDGQLVLIDFGTARSTTGTYMMKQPKGQITGVVSVGYTPPEQLHGQAIPQSDFFALGRTIIYLLTAEDPTSFYDPLEECLNWRVAAPSVSPIFAELLDRMMALNPKHRPQSATEILQQMQALQPKSASSSRQSDQPLQLQQTPTVAVPPPVQAKVVAAPPPASQSQPDPCLEPDFVHRCQQELAECIGPIALMICKRTLTKNPKASTQEFIEALAQQIPDSQQAETFRKRLTV